MRRGKLLRALVIFERPRFVAQGVVTAGKLDEGNDPAARRFFEISLGGAVGAFEGAFVPICG